MAGHDQVTIASVEAKYHLPPSRLGEKERLDRILPMAAEEALAAGLERLGYGGSEELCIREIRVPPLRLRLSGSDDALALAWGDAMAAAVDEAVRGGEAERVLRYPSRRQALADFARGVARGDLRHAWAWIQLGFGEAAGESGEASAELARALAADPEALVPILVVIAEEGLLPALARRFERGWWPQLAALALATVGWSAVSFHGRPVAAAQHDGAAVARAPVEAAPRRNAGNISEQIAAGHPAAASWRRARLAELFAILRVTEASPLAQALAALALLEADPGRLAAIPESERPTLLAAAVATLVSPLTPPEARKKPAAADGAAARTPAASDEEAATAEDPRSLPASGKAEDSLVARREGLTDWGGLLFLVGVADEIGLPEKIAAHPLLGSRPHRWCLHRLGLQLVPARDEDPAVLAFTGLLPREPPPEEEATEEEAAVLADLAEMLLLGLAERLRIPGAGETPAHPVAEPLDGNSSEDESPYWVRGRLARSSSPQSRELDAEGQLDAESELSHWERGRLARSLSDGGAEEAAEAALPERLRIPRAGETPALPVAKPLDGNFARSSRLELLELVCRRRARIVADPGWIEVHFSLDDVKTELRRARLDLDPGFVPWLGVVLRFVYE